MKIRDRLALFLTLSAAGVLLVMSLVIYYGSAYYIQQDFNNKLKKEARLRQQQWQKEDFNTRNYFSKTHELALEEGLSGISSHLIPLDNQPVVEDSLRAIFPVGFVDELFKKRYAEFQENEKIVAGQLFQQEEDDILIIVVANDLHGKAQLGHLRNLLIACFFGSLPLLYLFGRLSARQILKPIAGKIQKARRISASNLHLRLNVYNEKDEMGQLAITFNEMLDRLETSFDMQRNFISNASHEIRNPLTAILGETEVCLEKRRSPEKYIEALHKISREADRLDVLVNNLLNLSKAGFNETELVQEEIRLDEILLDARMKAAKAYPKGNIKFNFSGAPENPDLLTINGNSNLLKIAFTNLMENACKFSACKEVLVYLSASEKATQIKIIDKGVGIPQDEIKNISQPFYRARNARSFKGFGIGLSLTDKIIRLHQGQLNVFSEEGEGTTIEINISR